MHAITVYVPDEHLYSVKAAMFNAGAGKIGNYDYCAWQTKGIGQFRPLPGSTPAQGEIGKVEIAEEWKVELVCDDAVVEKVIQAMKAAHPYETPAYLIIKTEV